VTEEDMSVNIRMTRNTVTVHLIGRMAENILVNGAKENNMVKELILKMGKREMVSGKWERESSGLKPQMEQL